MVPQHTAIFVGQEGKGRHGGRERHREGEMGCKDLKLLMLRGSHGLHAPPSKLAEAGMCWGMQVRSCFFSTYFEPSLGSQS